MKNTSKRRLYLLCSLVLVGLLAIPALALASEVAPDGTTSASMPTIQSDKDDYPPGGTVVLTGGNWQPGESVHVYVNDDEGKTWSRNVDVTADENGNIRDEFQLPDWFVATYQVTATGEVSGTATTSFTDANLRFLSSGPTLSNISWQKYSNSTCTTAITTGSGNSGTGNITSNDAATLNIDAGTNVYVGLTAPATANSQSFSNWSRTSGNNEFLTFGSGNRTICARGDNSSGLSRFTAAYAAPTNSPPVANNDSYSVNEDSSLTIAAPGVLGNDTDANNNSLTAVQVSSPTNGSVTLNANGSFTYTPTGNFDGTASFTYKANDGTADSNTATVSIAVNPVNDAPSFTKGADQTRDEDAGAQSVTGWATNISAGPNESGQTVSFTTTNSNNSLFTTGGQPAVASNGTLTYTPAVNASGTATVTVTAKDNGGTANGGSDTSAPQTFTITINAVNDAPTASDDAYTTNEDTDLTVSAANGLLKNDTDIENNQLHVDDADANAVGINPISGPTHGSVTLNADGSFIYRPAANYSGSDSFDYRVCDNGSPHKCSVQTAKVNITINPVNDAPVAKDDSATTDEDTATVVDVLGNDTDVDNPATDLRVVEASISDPAHGTAELIASGDDAGKIRYTPAANYNNSGGANADTFTYKVSDGDGASENPATVSITVDPVNDAPTVGDITGAASANEGESKDYSVTATDVDGDTLTYAWTVESGAATVTDGAATNTATVRFLDGPDNVNLQVVVDDGKGGEVTRDRDGKLVSVSNVAPTTSLSDDNALAAYEGQKKTYAYTITDPGDDTVKSVETSCDAPDGVKVSDAPNSFECRFPDGPASATVTAQATDSDNDTGNEAEQTVEISNVKPSIALTGAETADEGDTKTYTFKVTDPGDDTYTADEACGSNGNKTDTAAADSFDCTFPDGPATTDVTVKVTDSDGATDTDNQKVTVAVSNVAPTATFEKPSEINEGSAIELSLTNPVDPGSADTTFEYAFDCGDGSGYGDFSGTSGANAKSCPTNDNGTRNVGAKIRDKDGGVSEYTASVTVANVAPTAKLNTPAGAVDEGSNFQLSLSDPADAGSNDTFEYAFDCDLDDATGYGAFGAQDSASCSTDDDGTRRVGAKIRDDDGGENTYTTEVTVKNVAPVVTAAADQASNEGEDKSFDLGAFTDPGDDGDWKVMVDWGDGSTPTDFESGTGSLGQKAHTYADNGTYTVTVEVSEAGSGTTPSDEDTFEVAVKNVAPTVTLQGPDKVDESATDGRLYEFTVSDPGPGDDGAQITKGCGDNGTLKDDSYQYDSVTGQGSFRCVFADGGPASAPTSSIVSVKATDKDGGSTTDSEKVVIVTVANVDPTIGSVTNDGTIDEGSPATITVAATDAGDPDPLSYEFDCDNDDTYEKGPQAADNANCTFDDDGTYTVGVKVTDGDGGEATGSTQVTVDNVEPSVTAAADQASNEGEDKSFDLGAFTDPGDDGPWQVSVDWGDGSNDNFTKASAGALGSLNHAYADNGTYTVTVKVSEAGEGQQPSDQKTFEVAVANVKPAITLSGAATADEDQTKTYDFMISDPGVNDTHTITTACGANGTKVSGSDAYSTATRKGFFKCFFPNGPATTDVTAKATDNDGLSDTDNQKVVVDVANVAPVVTAPADQASNEGQEKSFDLGAFTDPGPDGPWQVSVDWGDSSANTTFQSGTGSLDQRAHAYANNGSYTVKVKVAEAGGAPSDEKTFKVTVANVAPTAKLNTPAGAVDEGSNFQLSLSDPADAGSNDTFEYAFDCGSGYGDFGPSNTANCSTNDNGTLNVGGKIRDNDGGSTEYTGSVTVRNVAPTVTKIDATSTNVLAGPTNSVTFTGTATDPSSIDLSRGFYWQWALGSGSYTNFGAINANTYKTSFTGCGPQTVSAIAKDKDGGVSAPFTTNYSVNAYTGAYKAPLVDGTVNKVQKGQVVPVKISVGCGTTNLTGLSPHIQLLTGNNSPENETGSTAVTTSVSSADTGQTMRSVDGGYIYNLRVPSDSSATAGKQYTIRVNPFGADANNAATGMYIVLEIRK